MDITVPRDVLTVMSKMAEGLPYTEYTVGPQSEPTVLSEQLACRFSKPVIVTEIPYWNAPEADKKEMVVHSGRTRMFVGKPPYDNYAQWFSSSFNHAIVIDRWVPKALGSRELGAFNAIQMEIREGKLAEVSSFNLLDGLMGESPEKRLADAKIAYRAASEDLGIRCSEPEGAEIAVPALTPAQLIAMAKRTPLHPADETKAKGR